MKKSIGFLDLLTFVLSIYVIIVYAVDEFVVLPPNISQLLIMIDEFICSIFLFDFFYRFFTAENKWKFLKWGWIDLISSLPAFPIMRIGRLLRLVRLVRIFRSVKVLITMFNNRVKGILETGVTMTILILIVSSIGILIVEKDPASNIKTAVDAIYWSLASLASGFSGKFPVTMEGKIIGIIIMFTGIGLLGTITASITSWFIKEHNNNNQNPQT